MKTILRNLLTERLILLLLVLILAIACGNPEPEPPIPTPMAELSVEPTSMTIAALGEVKMVAVKSNVEWSAASSQSWCKVTPSKGNGAATVTLTVEPNAGSAARNAVVEFTSDKLRATVAVKQLGEEPYFAVVVSDSVFTPTSGEMTVKVTTNLEYVISSDKPWIAEAKAQNAPSRSVVEHIHKFVYGEAIATVQMATITVKAPEYIHQTVVTQLPTVDNYVGVTVGSNPEASNADGGSSQSAAVSSGDQAIAVSTPKPVQRVEVSKAVSWIRVIGAPNSSARTVAISRADTPDGVVVVVDENELGVSRSADLIFVQEGRADTLTINQMSTQMSEMIEVSATSIEMSSQASQNVTFTVASNIEYSAAVTPGADWLTLVAVGNKGTYALSATANPTISPRVAKIEIVGGSITRTIEVVQNGKPYLDIVGGVTYEVGYKASVVNFMVNSSQYWKSVISAPQWITRIDSTTSHSGTVKLSILENSTTSPRSATVTVSSIYSELTKIVTINQAAAPVVSDGGGTTDDFIPGEL